MKLIKYKDDIKQNANFSLFVVSIEVYSQKMFETKTSSSIEKLKLTQTRNCAYMRRKQVSSNMKTKMCVVRHPIGSS